MLRIPTHILKSNLFENVLLRSGRGPSLAPVYVTACVCPACVYCVGEFVCRCVCTYTVRFLCKTVGPTEGGAGAISAGLDGRRSVLAPSVSRSGSTGQQKAPVRPPPPLSDPPSPDTSRENTPEHGAETRYSLLGPPPPALKSTGHTRFCSTRSLSAADAAPRFYHPVHNCSF